MKLVKVKGWYRNAFVYSLLYSLKKRKFIKGVVKGKDIIYKLRPDKYIRFEYECNLAEKVPNTITLKLISIKNDATEEVIASSTIKYCFNTFLRRLEIPQIEDFDRVPYRTPSKVFNKIYGEGDNERLLLFVIANVNINEIEVRPFAFGVIEELLIAHMTAERAHVGIWRWGNEQGRKRLRAIYKLFNQA